MNAENDAPTPAPAHESEAGPPQPAIRSLQSASDRRFFALALWLCAAGAALLLLCPAAFNRRVLTMQNERAEADARLQFSRNADLEHRRDALETDPSVIEREARNNGFGRADEKAYPITAAEWKAARAHLATATPAAAEAAGAPSAVSQAFLPALMLILLGAMAVLFFCDLKVPEPGVRR